MGLAFKKFLQILQKKKAMSRKTFPQQVVLF
jgi:hypothetical protein